MLDPIKRVSLIPRAFKILSVKIWPLSGSSINCISSTARNSTGIFIGIDSTVQTQYLGLSGIILSSPVIIATLEGPTLETILSNTSLVKSLNGKPIIPDLCAASLSIA